MSKKVFAIFIAFFSLLFSSCGYESQSEKDYDYCEIVYEGFCNKDIESIKKLFCETTKKTHDLEKEILGSFETIDGDIISYERFDIGTDGEKIRDGKVVEKHSCPKICGITTSTGKIYEIVIQNQEICLEKPEYEGFSVIKILEIDPNDPYEWTKLYEIGEYIDYKISY